MPREVLFWSLATSFWNHSGHSKEGRLQEQFPQVDAALGTWVSHQQLDMPG